MNRGNLHRCTLRFSRTADEAFRTPGYANAVTYYTKRPAWFVKAWRAFVRWL